MHCSQRAPAIIIFSLSLGRTFSPSAMIFPTVFSNLRKLTGLAWPGWTIAAIRIFSFCSLAALTVRDFVPLVHEYINRNVAIEIAIIRNETVPRPNVTVCLPYHSGALINIARWIASNPLDSNYNGNRSCEECRAMANRSWDVWTTDHHRPSSAANFTAKPRLDDIVANLTFDIVQRLLTDGDFSSAILDESNFNWNQPIVDAIWATFACQLQLDTDYLTGHQDIFPCSPRLTEEIDWTNSDLDRLWTLVTDATAMYFDFFFSVTRAGTDQKGEPELSPIRSRYGLSIFGEYFCFPLLKRSSSETYLLTLYKGKDEPPWRRFKRTLSYYVLPDETILYSAVNGLESLYKTNPVVVELTNYEDVSLAYAIDTRVTEGRPEHRTKCSREPSPPVCVAKRQFDLALRSCGCVPYSFKYFSTASNSNSTAGLSANWSYCTKRAYNECESELRTNLVRTKEECNNKCEYVLYKWQQNSVVKQDESRKGAIYVVSIRPMNSVFIEFTTITRDTPEKFLSQIGGLANLYLGFSGLSACAFIVFCIRILKRRKELAKIDEGEQRTSEATTITPKAQLVRSATEYGSQYGWPTDMVDERRRGDTKGLDELKERMKSLEIKMERIDDIQKDVRTIKEALERLKPGSKKVKIRF